MPSPVSTLDRLHSLARAAEACEKEQQTTVLPFDAVFTSEREAIDTALKSTRTTTLRTHNGSACEAVPTIPDAIDPSNDTAAQTFTAQHDHVPRETDRSLCQESDTSESLDLLNQMNHSASHLMMQKLHMRVAELVFELATSHRDQTLTTGERAGVISLIRQLETALGFFDSSDSDDEQMSRSDIRSRNPSTAAAVRSVSFIDPAWDQEQTLMTDARDQVDPTYAKFPAGYTAVRCGFGHQVPNVPPDELHAPPQMLEASWDRTEKVAANQDERIPKASLDDFPAQNIDAMKLSVQDAVQRLEAACSASTFDEEKRVKEEKRLLEELSDLRRSVESMQKEVSILQMKLASVAPPPDLGSIETSLSIIVQHLGAQDIKTSDAKYQENSSSRSRVKKLRDERDETIIGVLFVTAVIIYIWVA
ncbi:hypothetical protein HKX48_004230 [Thoreauomyces humboldtii]|nr:hypothetical protein HKX48_004230 [Thoreauomyces humboldtii]